MASGALGKRLAKAAPSIFKETEPKLGNLFIGATTTAFVGMAAFGGIAGPAAYKAVSDIQNQQETGQVSYYGNIPDYAYDAQPQVDRITGDKTLGATGDLVFGLNARKHGGR